MVLPFINMEKRREEQVVDQRQGLEPRFGYIMPTAYFILQWTYHVGSQIHESVAQGRRQSLGVINTQMEHEPWD